VDALGNPLYIQLSSGNIHDSTAAVEILSHVKITDSVVQADRAYGSLEIRDYIESQNATYNIPPKVNNAKPWDCDWWLYKERHLVECFFQKLKQFRRVATRYEKLASRFLSFVFLACICILVK
jgi:transposase